MVTKIGFEDDTKIKFFENFQTAELPPSVTSTPKQTELETRPRKNILRIFLSINKPINQDLMQSRHSICWCRNILKFINDFSQDLQSNASIIDTMKNPLFSQSKMIKINRKL